MQMLKEQDSVEVSYVLLNIFLLNTFFADAFDQHTYLQESKFYIRMWLRVFVSVC